MIEGGVKKRLSAILAADVVGYTRLMEQDSDGTVAAWQAARANVIDPSIAEHSGRIVKHTGDGFLAEFPTVQDAVQCAVAMQNGLALSMLDFRMGINLGDIIDDGEDIHGEGVNIAARIEALADPGGICISGMVHESIRNRLEQTFEDLGEHEVKHVSAPVRVFRAVIDGVKSKKREIAVPALSDKPSIAVLAFDNISGDPEQVFFADGIVEDIITELSRYNWLLVIARNTSFTFKGKSVDIKDVGKQLNVRYVMEGSVRKSGDRVRITAQLIDVQSGGHVWAERYDRELADIFALQDEITQAVAGAIQPELLMAEAERARRKIPGSMAAWDYAVRGRSHVLRVTKEDNAEGRRLLREGLALEPNDVSLLAFLSFGLLSGVLFGWSDDPGGWIAEANQLAQKAAKLEDNDVWVQCALGFCQFMAKQPEKAIAHYNKAISLNPSFALGHGYLALQLAFAGDPGDAIMVANTAIRLSPRDPELFHFYVAIGTAHFVAGRHEEAADWAEKSVRERPDAAGPLRLLATSLAHMGRIDEARVAFKKVLKITPCISATSIRSALHFGSSEALNRYIEGMSLTGLLEGPVFP
jgi:adenylate cyclase